MALPWIAPALAALASSAPVPSGDDTLPEGALVRLGGWTLRHRDPVSAVAAGEKGLLSTGMEGGARLWSMEDGELLAALDGDGTALVDAALLPSGEALLLRADGAFVVWPLDGPATDPRGGDLGMRLAVAPTGLELCVTGRDGVARLVTVETGSVCREIDLGDLQAGPAAYSPAGDRLAVVGQNRSKLLRRGGTGDQPSAVLVLADAGTAEVKRRIVSQERNLLTVAFTPDGARVVATDDRGAVRVWRVADGELELAREADLPTPARGLALAENGDVAVLGRDDGRIELVSLADGGAHVNAHAIGVPLGPLAVSSDGRHLASAAGVEVRLFDLPGLEPRVATERHRGPIAAIAWSTDGTLVATGSYDHDARVWDAATGAPVLVHRAGSGFVYAVDLTDGRLVAGGQDGHVHVVDLEQGALERDVLAHAAACTDLALSPDGTLCATAGADRVLQILDVATGESRHAVSDLPGIQFHVAWSPDGSRVAVGASDVRLVDAATGEVVKTLPRLPALMTALAFDPGGRTIAAGLADRTVVLQDLDGAPRRFLHGHTGRVTALAYSPDGRWLATASANETGARLWSMPEGKPAGTLEGFEREVFALAFDPAGRRLAAGSMDGTALIWTVPE